MIVEIHEILIQKEKLSYPCDQLTVGFISEAEFQAFVKQADLSLPMPKQTETLMRNAVSVNEEAFLVRSASHQSRTDSGRTRSDRFADPEKLLFSGGSGGCG